jgi:prepilin-type N-terminal cleavage/methylation domain-containing protein
MQRGFSLLELLLVLVILGLVVLIGTPRLAEPLARITVEQEVQRLARAHAMARMLALTTSRVAVLKLHPDSLTIGLVTAGDTVPRWREAGPATRGVALTGPAHSVLVAPTTIGFGVSNGTWTVTYRGVTRSIVLSRLGRLRVVR